jgi:hypothetical protein
MQLDDFSRRRRAKATFLVSAELRLRPAIRRHIENVGVREQLYRAPLLRRVLIDANRTKSKAVILHFRKP